MASRPILVSFKTYEEAQAAVDNLSDNKFPVEHVTIIGNDLRSVEVVLGRMSWGRAALGDSRWVPGSGCCWAVRLDLRAVGNLAADGDGDGGPVWRSLRHHLRSHLIRLHRRQARLRLRSTLVATTYDVTVDPGQLAEARRCSGEPDRQRTGHPATSTADCGTPHRPPLRSDTRTPVTRR